MKQKNFDLEIIQSARIGFQIGLLVHAKPVAVYIFKNYTYNLRCII